MAAWVKANLAYASVLDKVGAWRDCTSVYALILKCRALVGLCGRNRGRLRTASRRPMRLRLETAIANRGPSPLPRVSDARARATGGAAAGAAGFGGGGPGAELGAAGAVRGGAGAAGRAGGAPLGEGVGRWPVWWCFECPGSGSKEFCHACAAASEILPILGFRA
jgi:hypothetical protein